MWYVRKYYNFDRITFLYPLHLYVIFSKVKTTYDIFNKLSRNAKKVPLDEPVRNKLLNVTEVANTPSLHRSVGLGHTYLKFENKLSYAL